MNNQLMKWMDVGLTLVKCTSVWLVLNIPLLWVLVNLLLTTEQTYFNLLLYSIFLLLPFSIIPSSVVIIAIVRQIALNGQDFALFRYAIKSFKTNYLLSVQIGSVYTIILWLLLNAALFYDASVRAVFILLIIVLTGYMFVLLAYCCDRVATLRIYLLNTWRILFKEPLLFTFLCVSLVMLSWFCLHLQSLSILVLPGAVHLFVYHFYGKMTENI